MKTLSDAKLPIVLIMLAACGRSSSCGEQKPKVRGIFTCQRKAVTLKDGHEVETYGARVCERRPMDESFYGPTFTTAIAYCFTASTMVLDQARRGGVSWGAGTEERCSPTPEECAGNHDWLGKRAMGRPPVKTACRKEELEP
jgi:hypothetical protein